MKVYEVVARALADEQVGAVFALVGNANMEMLATLDTLDGPAIYHARIEGTAVGMAEGWARSSGRVGVACITSGPALTNATNALTSAARAHTPLVLITGHPDSRENHQTFPQQSLAELTGAAYFDIPTAGAALDVIKAAFWTARTEKHPVVLDIGRRVQGEEYAWSYTYEPSFAELRDEPPMPPARTALDEALALIASSERPVIVAGHGAYDSGARAEITTLATEIGALLATSLHVKNWFTGEPFNCGVAGLFSWQYAAEIFAEADLVIGVGASLNHYTTEGGYLFPAAQFIQIDTREHVLTGTGKRADVYVRGDARTTTAALIDAVREKALTGTRFRTPEIAARIAAGAADPDPATFDIAPGRVDPRRVLNVVDAGLPDECGIVVGTAHNWGLSNSELRRWRDPQLYSHAFGSIGIAFPLCLGAAIAHPGRPFVHVEGDGSLMMTVHGFDTMARYNLPILVVVLNDSAFSAEAHQLVAKGISPDIANLSDVDFAAVGAAFGNRTAVIRSTDDMERLVAEFRANPGPTIADVRVSREVISVAVRRLHYGISA